MLVGLLTSRNTKGAISSIYDSLLDHWLSRYPLKARACWSGELGDIDDDTWSDILAFVPEVSVSCSQCLTQLFILHRVYSTPVVLHRAGLRDSPLCPKCHAHSGDLLHLLWRCPKLRRYWEQVVQCINKVFKICLSLDPRQCILNDLETVVPDKQHIIAVTRCLFIAQKLIAQRWMASSSPEMNLWVTEVNRVLRLEK